MSGTPGAMARFVLFSLYPQRQQRDPQTLLGEWTLTLSPVLFSLWCFLFVQGLVLAPGHESNEERAPPETLSFS